MKKYEKEAAQFCEAIKLLAKKPENLENLESYLSYHFGEWMEKYASDPQNLTAEIGCFANMII